MNYWLAELVLAVSALLVSGHFWSTGRDRHQSPALLMVAGLCCLALAALAGAYRYGVDPRVTDLHRALSHLSGYISFPAIGIALLWVSLGLPAGDQSRAPAYVILVLVTGAALGMSGHGGVTPAEVTSFFSALGLLLWLAAAMRQLLVPGRLSRVQAVLLALGAPLVIIAGLLVGTDSAPLWGLARINWFHLLLAAALWLLLCGRPLFAHRAR
ncbi:hypothetical protein [Microbulbifer discodermiae]|uniref:hypothetical protein n=1 Tax=Microbulbifer sp. 2201CG32-9 TaxID=3232309 RepID=UPI00345B5AAD